MNKDRFNTYLTHPETMNEASLAELRQVVSDFPYFTAGRIMLLRNLNLTNDSDYEKELPLTAIYAGNRSILYSYIFDQSTKPQTTEEIPVEVEEIPRTESGHEPSEHVTEEKKEDHSDASDPHIQNPGQEETISTPTPTTQLSAADDLHESTAHTFSNWLELMSEQTHTPVSPAPKKKKSWDLIDSFILESPKIQKANEDAPKKVSASNLADDSALHHEEFMTETLAKIYIRQKHYDKAIQIFKKLSLKYPEKSIYFAGQIKIVEQLINNEK